MRTIITITCLCLTTPSFAQVPNDDLRWQKYGGPAPAARPDRICELPAEFRPLRCDQHFRDNTGRVPERERSRPKKDRDDDRCPSCERMRERHESWERSGKGKGDGSNGGKPKPEKHRQCKEKGYF